MQSSFFLVPILSLANKLETVQGCLDIEVILMEAPLKT